tara:strand:- start:15 stop:440 length:426 start_codon:yes stop_codon:yes gene_type:complete
MSHYQSEREEDMRKAAERKKLIDEYEAYKRILRVDNSLCKREAAKNKDWSDEYESYKKAVREPNGEENMSPFESRQIENMLINKEHYKGGIEPTEYIKSNNLDFFEGNVVKYITRWRKKDGINDLRKAKDYIEMLIKQEIG